MSFMDTLMTRQHAIHDFESRSAEYTDLEQVFLKIGRKTFFRFRFLMRLLQVRIVLIRSVLITIFFACDSLLRFFRTGHFKYEK